MRTAKLAGLTRPKGKRGRPSKVELEARAKLSTKTNETPTQRVERIAERFKVMYKLTQGALRGTVRSLIVSGAPGTGKSFTIRRLLEWAKDNAGIRYDIVSGGNITPIGLYKLLFDYSGEKDVILIDDCDVVYSDEMVLNMLKAALDTGEDRRISWHSESNALKAEDIPASFLYKGSIIFITNKDIRTAIEFDTGKMIPHYRALVDRSVYLDLKLHDQDDILAWVSHMTTKHHMLVQMGLTAKQELEVVAWITKNVDNIASLSLRTVRQVASFMLTDENTWESFAKVTILK